MIRLLRRFLRPELAASPFQGRELQAPGPAGPGESTFVVGVGRSGTHFFARLMAEDASVRAYHLDTLKASVGDSFVAYAAWYGLPVDRGGLLASRATLIADAAREGRAYVESNLYLSFSIGELHAELGSRFIMVVRQPEEVIASHEAKGWYRRTPVLREPGSLPGYQYDAASPNHFFARVIPTGDEFRRWEGLTQIGPIAWMWNAHNLRMLELLDGIPEDRWRLAHTEEVDYVTYRELHEFAGGRNALAEAAFDRIRRGRPGKGPRKRSPREWSSREREEFMRETSESLKRLGYDKRKREHD